MKKLLGVLVFSLALSTNVIAGKKDKLIAEVLAKTKVRKIYTDR